MNNSFLILLVLEFMDANVQKQLEFYYRRRIKAARIMFVSCVGLGIIAWFLRNDVTYGITQQAFIVLMFVLSLALATYVCWSWIYKTLPLLKANGMKGKYFNFCLILIVAIVITYSWEGYAWEELRLLGYSTISRIMFMFSAVILMAAGLSFPGLIGAKKRKKNKS